MLEHVHELRYQMRGEESEEKNIKIMDNICLDLKSF